MADPAKERAAHAATILEDDTFQMAIVAITERLYGDFALSPSGERGDEARRGAHHSLLALNGIVTELKQLVTTGEFTQQQQEAARSNVENFRNRRQRV